MRRLRTALLVPAMVFAGGLASAGVSAAISTAPASGAVGICIATPTGGCLPVPCPPRIFCPYSASATAAKI